ncbi:hypothetical protein CLU97_0952 [Chryseobacterium sp. 7]|uniref:hypothetical protein n=1 Tax=Chryseobacterium sp. 7 TaxID=2035214 RepID=UPI000EB15A94|nr:hypothetical protein [Chryseobacterium sp. 7]RLJ31528.1 hypothetical protein CLU97_0952 [Chryseobacterium sp. 7]
MEFKYNSPILYFVNIFKDVNLNAEIRQYLSLGFEENTSSICNVDNDKGIIYLNDVVYSFESFFYQVLHHELATSQALIDHYLIQNAEKMKDYIKYLQSDLQYIINNNPETFYKFPSFIYFITEIRDYVNNKFISNPGKQLVLSIPNFNVLKTNYTNDDELLHLVLGYLKGQNEKREKIMPDDDFEFLISTIKAYISNKTTEVGDRRIKEVKISRQLLSFTFWVLHKHLYGRRPRKADFLALIKQLFVNFDGTGSDPFYKKFGSKSQVTYKGLAFIPQIIKQELEDRN